MTALQALSLLNNKFTLAMSQHFANRLAHEGKGSGYQIKAGFELVAGRPPNPEEFQLLVQYEEKHGMANLCRALFSLSEFSFID